MLLHPCNKGGCSCIQATRMLLMSHFNIWCSFPLILDDIRFLSCSEAKEVHEETLLCWVYYLVKFTLVPVYKHRTSYPRHLSLVFLFIYCICSLSGGTRGRGWTRYLWDRDVPWKKHGLDNFTHILWHWEMMNSLYILPHVLNLSVFARNVICWDESNQEKPRTGGQYNGDV